MTNQHTQPCKFPRHPANADGPIAAIWSAARMQRWHVPVLSGANSSLPYIALEGEEPVALFFTTRRRVRAAIDGWIGGVSDIPVRGVQIDFEKAMQVLARLHARGLQWIRIDHGPRSIRLPLESLVGAMQHEWERQTDQCAEACVWDWLGRQERVLVLRDPATDDLPLVEIIDELPTIRLFVDMRRAMAQAVRLSLHADDSRERRVISMGGAESVDCLRRLAHLGVECLVIEQPGGQRQVPLAALLQQARRAA
jgi:hypothetical protein